RPSLDALEDQVEHHAAELGILAQRLGEEAPARLGALLEAGESEYLLHRSARDLVVDALSDPQQQLLLGSELPGDGALRDAALLGQEVERGPGDAACGQQPHGRLEDGFLGPHAALLARASGRAPWSRVLRRTGRWTAGHN